MAGIRILLADDHRLFRFGLKQLIDARPGFDIIGEAGNGFEAADMAAKLKPDVIFLDISMPLCNGIEAAQRILEQKPETRIVILSMHSDKRYVAEALRVGAKGYLLKDSAPEELFQAINRVVAGQFFLSSGVNQQIIADYISLSAHDEVAHPGILSVREREVLKLIAEGLSTKQSADRLNLSVKTVETHRLNLMEKLNLHSVAELTKYAIREGLIEL